MTLKSACLIAVAFLLTRSAIAADPAQTPSSTASPVAAAPPQAVAPAPNLEPLIGAAQPAGEAVVEVLDVPPPPKYRDLWVRIRSGFAMQEIDSPLVARHEAWYLNRPEYVQRMVERSRLYLYFVVEELEKRGMPTEIALLPMIESAYNPQAYSRMRAAGMWQFIPSTGKKYGLQQNFWYDGRRDVLAATRAALDYLQVPHDTRRLGARAGRVQLVR
jgi:membrane-bound lytic murein transglycosylase D